MKNYSLSLILLFALMTVAFAQSDNNAAARLEVLQKSREMQRNQMNSPESQQMMRNSMRRSMMSNYEGPNHGMVMGMLQMDHFREALGVTEEQNRRIQDVMRPSMNPPNDPELRSVMDEMGKLHAENPGGPFGENTSEETRKKFTDLQEKMQDAFTKRMENAVNDNMTPDQIKKIQEYNLSMVSHSPFVSPKAFEALDLSDDQKVQLDQIKKEMAPEFERYIEKWADTQAKFNAKIQKDMQDDLDEKLKDVTDPDEFERILREPRSIRVDADSVEHQEMMATQEAGTAFTNRLRLRVSDILTDEQRERLERLINDPPEYIKKMQGRYLHHPQMTQDAPQPESEWRPGPDSWKPGDGVPEEYVEEQRARFPGRTQ